MELVQSVMGLDECLVPTIRRHLGSILCLGMILSLIPAFVATVVE
jgi:hypothetical protein